jgi:hypothetical protein
VYDNCLDDESYVACNVPLPALSFGGTSSVAFRSAFSLMTSAKPIDVTDSSAMNESPAHLIKNREFIGFSLYSVERAKTPRNFNPLRIDMFRPTSPLGTVETGHWRLGNLSGRRFAENLRHVFEGHFVSGYADGGDAPDKQIELVHGAVNEAQSFLIDDQETQGSFFAGCDLGGGI